MNRIVLLSLLACASAFLPAFAADYPEWGGSPSKNNVINDDDARKVPLTWNVGDFDFDTGHWQPAKSKNIRWVARLGSNSFGNPTVAGGRVFVGSNNERGYVKRFPGGKVDLGTLLCFDEKDGKFLWQYSAAKLATGDKHDYAATGICSSPLVIGDRVYVVTNRCEVVCLDVKGFYDGKNDGVEDEANENMNEADVVWRFDMMKELGVEPVFMTASNITALDAVLLIHTCNSADEKAQKIPKPDAPSFIALTTEEKAIGPGAGRLRWKNNSPGANILHGSWSSPAMNPKRREAYFAGGDAWLYAFDVPVDLQEAQDAVTSPSKPRFLWKFDCNRKTAVWKSRGEGDRTSVIGTPVVVNDRGYIATGQITEHADTPAALICVDVAKARKFGGDVSEELVFNPKHDAGKTPIPHKRELAADLAAGDIVKQNPNSALAWRYTGEDLNKNGKLDVAEVFHRCISTVAVKDGLAFAVDMTGIIHCVDAKTGKAYWTHDMLAGSWSSPMIAGDRVYICNDNGEVIVFALAREKKVLAENDMKETIYSTPVVANGVLYIMTKSRLFAIEAK
jgi:outer membrane protein assembly factor BamB